VSTPATAAALLLAAAHRAHRWLTAPPRPFAEPDRESLVAELRAAILAADPHAFSTVRERMAALIAGQFGRDLGDLNPAQDLAELGGDSRDVAELTIAVDRVFGVMLDEELWTGLRTVGEWLDAVERAVAAAPAAAGSAGR